MILRYRGYIWHKWLVPLYFFGNLLFEKMESLEIHFEKIKILFSLQILCTKKGKLSINPCKFISKFQTSIYSISELREPILTISSAKWPRCWVLLEGFEEKTKFWIFRNVFPDLPFFQTTNFRYYGEGGMCPSPFSQYFEWKYCIYAHPPYACH